MGVILSRPTTVDNNIQFNTVLYILNTMRLPAELALFCLLSVTHVEGKFSRLYPEDREVLYKYEAIVTTGTKYPAPFVSRFNLTGNIKMQGLKEDHTKLQFINLKHSMYSGEENSSKIAETVDLPKEAEGLLEPFGIEYSEGKVSALQLSAEEATWSKSVKQALAGVMQLDLFNINSLDEQKAFKSKEKSIYGECLVSYKVTPQQNGTEITKFQSGLDCPKEEDAWSNIENINCPDFKSHQHNLISTSAKGYNVVSFDSDSLLIQKVSSEGQTFIFTNPNSGHTHSITVSQKLEFQSISESFEMLEINNSTEIKTLEYDPAEYYSFKFSTNEDLGHIVKMVFQLLKVIVYQLQGPNQLLPVANPQQAQLIPLLITYLRKLNDTHLETIFMDLGNQDQPSQMNIFLNILPVVGSKESSVFIVKLISSNKLSEPVALLLLFSLPFNIRQASEEILQKLEGLINLPEEIRNSVRNTAVLSFATLIYRMCGVDKCRPEVIDKYVLHYIKQIKENDHDYAVQLTYITGLQNIRSQEIIKDLEPLTFGRTSTFDSNNLQEAALRAMSPLFTKDPVKAYNFFWPVLTDKSSSLQVRATALMALLEGEVTNSTFLQIHQFMDSEKCLHLYNLYYSLLSRYAEDSSKCNNKRSESARQVIRITRKPSNLTISSSQIKCDLFGEEVLLTVFGNSTTNSINSGYISFTSTLTGYSINYYSVFFKLQGVVARSIKDIAKVFTSPSELQTLVPAKVKTSDLHSEPLQIELIVYNQGQAVATRFYNESSINHLFTEIGSLITLKNNRDFSYEQISASYNLEKYFVTDIGIPGVLSVDNPFISSFQGEVNVNSSNLTTSTSIRQWSQGTTVLKVKNTIVNIWQGIIQSHISRFNLPFSFQLNLDNNQGNVSFITPDSSDDATIGFKWSTNTDIFTVTYSDSYNALSQSCQSCNATSIVTKQKAANEVLTDISYDSFTVSSSIFDCENDGSGEKVKFVHDTYTRNVFSVLGVVASSGFYLDNFLSKQAISGSCGYAVSFVPRNARQQSKICVNVNDKKTNGEDTCNHNSESSFMTFFGNFPFSDQDCYFDNTVSLNITVEATEKDSEDIKDQCDLNTNKKEWECNTPRILAYMPKATEQSNKNVKAEVQFVQVSENVGASLQKLCTKLKNRLLQYAKSSNISQDALLDVIKSKFSIVYNGENGYILRVDSPSTNLALNSIPTGITPDLISFLNKVINQYVMPCDSIKCH